MMKKLILIAVIISGSLLFGQSYNPIVVNGNKWDLLCHIYPSYVKYGNSSISGNYLRTEVLKLSSDTSVRDTAYKILLSSFDSLSSNWTITGFLREDIVNKKVYYRPAKIPHDVREQEEYLLYDFGLKVKDTMKYKDYSFKLVVDTIDTVIYSGLKYKRIKFNYCVEWIEGIGDLNGLLSTTMDMPCAITKPKLLCFFNNDLLLYKMNNIEFDKCFYWEDYVNSINEINNVGNIFDIFPNPANDEIFIHSRNGNVFDTYIYDFQGQLVISKRNLNNDANIDTKDFSNGMYFIKIINPTNSFSYKLIIKHK